MSRIYSSAGIRAMTVFMHIMEFYMMGFRYNTGDFFVYMVCVVFGF